MIKIDEKIPVPHPNKNKGRKRKYPFHEMEIGSSFFILDRTTESIGGIVTYAKKTTAFKFRTLNVKECPVCRTELSFVIETWCKKCEKTVKSEAGVRVWRVE